MKRNKEDQKRILSNKNIFFLLLAFAIIIIFYFMPTPEGLTFEGKLMLGMLIMAAILWVTEPIPLPATGLLIMIMQPILGILPAKDVFSSFGNQAIFFLIGAFIIAAAIEKHGLHRRIALRFLRFFEKSPRTFTFGIISSCAFLWYNFFMCIFIFCNARTWSCSVVSTNNCIDSCRYENSTTTE